MGLEVTDNSVYLVQYTTTITTLVYTTSVQSQHTVAVHIATL